MSKAKAKPSLINRLKANQPRCRQKTWRDFLSVSELKVVDETIEAWIRGELGSHSPASIHAAIAKDGIKLTIGDQQLGVYMRNLKRKRHGS